MLVLIIFSQIWDSYVDSYLFSITIVKFVLLENKTYGKNIDFKIFYAEFVNRIKVYEQNFYHLKLYAHTHNMY